MKEGPERITVFDLVHRTTGSVEAYNGVLGKLIPAKSNLFQFVSKLQLHEEKKAFDANLLDTSGGESAESKKAKSTINSFFFGFFSNSKMILFTLNNKLVFLLCFSIQARDNIIQTANNALKTKQINFSAFLKRVTFDKQKVCGSMATFETVDALETVDVYDELDYEHEDNSSKQQSSYVRLCSVCKENEPDVTPLPCRHQCLCKPCYRQWNRVDTGFATSSKLR